MDKRLGIYIHIPFCASKCAYCDFYSMPGCDEQMPRYKEALAAHIKEASPQLDGYIIDTVYFGGGTPSHFGAGRIISVFNSLKKYGNVLLDSEVTVEVNPDSITYADLLRMRRAGINRLSVGVQSSDDKILKSIGRQHTFADAERTVSDARRAGFDNISLDLIYGLPSQTREGWAETLTRAAALKPEHFSCYGLKIEPGTPLYIYKTSPFIPDDDAQADMYLYTIDALERFGYRQYEISNFARRGHISQHNMKYWSGQEYMGFGAAAHSYMGGQRFSYIDDMAEYADRVLSGGSVIDQCEQITPFEKAGEYLMLALRTTKGISEKEYYEIFPCDFTLCRKMLDSFVEKGWMVKNDDRWSFNSKGFLISNTLINEVLDAHTNQRTAMGMPWMTSETDLEQQYTFFQNSDGEVRLFNGIS